jgi:uncharacterized delta-60 repeat protein
MVVAVAGPASAAPGDLDPTFSGDGQAATAFSHGSAAATSVAVQRDGKIVVAGYVRLSGGHLNDRWALARYKPGGALDQASGTNGLVVTDWTKDDDEAWGVVVLGNGRIVAGGYAGGKFAADRYTSSGHLDPTFGGGDGKVTVDFGKFQDQAWDVAKAPGGKIVLAGQAGPAAHSVVAIARLDADGTLDHSFSGDGKATEDVFGGPSYAWDALPRPDGSIVVTGNANGGTNDAAMVTEFTPTGGVDTTFGDTGAWIASAPANAYANAIVRLASGKFMVVAAVGQSNVYDVGLFRFLANGRQDDTFGSSGLVTRNFGSSQLPTDLQRSGKLLLVSFTRVRSNHPNQMAVARLKTNGTPDTTFGHQGLAVAGLPAASGEGLGIESDGKIVAVGGSFKVGTDRFGVARFLAS